MKKLTYILFCILLISMFFATAAYAEKTLYVSSVEGRPGLYLSPDKDSFKITDIPGCAELRLIKSEGMWGNVVFANKCGWINLSFTRATYEDAAEATGYDSPKNVETVSDENKTGLYTLPSDELKHGSEKKYTVPDGTVLKVTRETSDGWGLVPINEEYFWVKLENTKPYVTETEQVMESHGIYYIYTFSGDGKGVKLYSDSKGNGLLTTITDCMKLTVRETENNYAYISYNGINGWINLENTTESFANAQANTGKEVNAEYKISEEVSSNVEILSVPSDKKQDAAVVLGNIDAGTEVFVQRCTDDGWMLVNHEGKLGWIRPFSAQPQPDDDALLITPLKNKKEGYVSTGRESGLELYPLYDSRTVVARIPECVKVEMIAEKEGKKYVYCDYASGWTDSEVFTDSYETAVNAQKLKKTLKYAVKKDLGVMYLPMNELLCDNRVLASVKKGEELEILRIVSCGKEKWGLVNKGSVKGWVKISGMSRIYSPLEITLFSLCSLAGLVLIVFAVIFAVRKIKKVIKNRKKSASDEENGEEISESIPENTEEIAENDN